MPPRAISLWLDTVPDQRRFPPLEGWTTVDVAVIGGGIAGLMTAWNLAAKGRTVALLEKNHLATGDTGLTTAFLTRVPDTGAADLLDARGAEWLSRLFAATSDAQHWFKDLVRREGIACDLVDCVSYNCSYRDDDAELNREWGALKQAGAGASFIKGADVTRCGVPAVREAIRFDEEARFHIRKLVFGLLARPTGRRIQIFEETEVTRLEDGSRIVVGTDRGSVLCKAVVCTTGRPIDALAECQAVVKPIITYVVAAKYAGAPPMSDNLFWDTGEPYQYFRLFDDRTVILGGGDRPAADAGRGEPAHAKLRAFLAERLGGAFDVTHEWSGTLYDTADGLPYITEHPHYPGRVFLATGFGGNGMVMGTMAGRILADLATRTPNRHAPLFEFGRTGVKISAPATAAVTDRAGAAPAFVPVLPATDLPAGGSRVVTANGRRIALFSIAGTVYALDNACSHAGGPLADGALAGTVITCPLHRSQFDVRTGAVCAGPASRPQRTYRARVNGPVIEVEI